MAGSPLLGYNTNVRHLGKLFHIQTEDSGVGHGHIFTHLFADGGRIIASKKTTYSQFVGTESYPDVVKKLMRESHKAMFIALRDGLFDDDEQAGAAAMNEVLITVDGTVESESSGRETPVSVEVDIDTLERAAEARLQKADAQRVPATPPPSPGRYASTRPAAGHEVVGPVARRAPSRPNPASESIFGGDLLSEKSLDEVILSYLAEDVEDEP